jgi:DNA-binding MarR family transcriptional regulator
MVKNLAKQAMTTKGQKACYVVDHLVEALAGDPSSSLRRALILCDIDQHPGTTQAEIMERLEINKSSLNREIDWLFNYGCVMRQASQEDGREVRLEICGYSKKALVSALYYFRGNHQNLKMFLEEYIDILKQERPTLRDAKIISVLYEKKSASKQEVIDALYRGPSSTDNRAVNELINEGIVANDDETGQ